MSEEIPTADDDTIIVTGSQHGRIDGIVPSPPPTSIEEFNALMLKSEEELVKMGLLLWERLPNLYSHWLYPGEWFNSLPESLPVKSISGETKIVGVDELSDDTRFGALAYGFIKPFIEDMTDFLKPHTKEPTHADEPTSTK